MKRISLIILLQLVFFTTYSQVPLGESAIPFTEDIESAFAYAKANNYKKISITLKLSSNSNKFKEKYTIEILNDSLEKITVKEGFRKDRYVFNSRTNDIISPDSGIENNQYFYKEEDSSEFKINRFYSIVGNDTILKTVRRKKFDNSGRLIELLSDYNIPASSSDLSVYNYIGDSIKVEKMYEMVDGIWKLQWETESFSATGKNQYQIIQTKIWVTKQYMYCDEYPYYYWSKSRTIKTSSYQNNKLTEVRSDDYHTGNESFDYGYTILKFKYK